MARSRGLLSRLLFSLRLFRSYRKARREGRSAEDAIADVLGGEFAPETSTGLGLSEAACEYLEAPPFSEIYPDEFVLHPEHIAVIRSLPLSWNGAEAGAPMVDSTRLCSRDEWCAVLSPLLAERGGHDLVLARAMVSLVPALREWFAYAELEPGDYRIAGLTAEEVETAGGGVFGGGAHGIEGGSFRLTAEDRTLLRNLSWEWDREEWAPTADPKRPYGDMSNYPLDVHRHLGWPVEKRDEEGFIALTEAQEAEAERLHLRSLAAAQLLLEHGRWPAGPTRE